MPLPVSITLDDLYAKLGTFLATVVPTGWEVVKLPVNRAAMPKPDPGFVGMTANAQKRIMTNLHRWDEDGPDPTTMEIEQGVKLAVKLDCYGATSGDLAAILATILRDEYAVTALAPLMAPLYVDDPRFGVLINGEEEYEQRWLVLAYFQYNPVVTTPAEFFNEAVVGTINVDEAYPP